MDGAGELEKIYRVEATRIRAALAVRLGDAAWRKSWVRDAFVEALEHWRADGLPPNPGSWLATTAWRKALDRLRRERAGQEKLALLPVTQAPKAGTSGHPAEPCGLDPGGSQDEADELLGLVVVISNCVINLSADKPRVLAEAFRVLRPGGRRGISDITADDGTGPGQLAEAEQRTGCGATLTQQDYRDLLQAAGFTGMSITCTHEAGPGLHSAIIQAAKPAAQHA